MIQLEDVKNYLRVDSEEDDELIISLISSSKNLCMSIARITEDEFEKEIDSLKIAIYYAIAYMYEHREEANHKELTLNLRALLFNVRRSEFWRYRF